MPEVLPAGLRLLPELHVGKKKNSAANSTQIQAGTATDEPSPSSVK